MQKQSNKQNGFTLVELLVVIALFGLVSMISTSAIISIIRTNTKSKILNVVRDNTGRVLDQVEKDLRFAYEASNPGGNVKIINLRKESGYYQYRVVEPGSGSNNYIERGEGCSASYSGCTYVRVTPNDTKNGVNVDATKTSFTVSTYGEVRISLNLTQPIGLPNRTEYQVSIQMEDSIIMRNFHTN